MLQCGTRADPFAIDTCNGSGNMFLAQPASSHMPVRPMVALQAVGVFNCHRRYSCRVSRLVPLRLRFDLILPEKHSCYGIMHSHHMCE